MTISKVALSALRRQFEPDLVKGERSRFVPQLEDRFVLAADRLAAVDVHEFEAAMREAERARAGDPAAAASAYARALGVYRGNLLEDALFEAHFVPEREAFRQQALGAARWLAEHHRQAGRLDEATAVLRAAVGWAPCEEELYIEIMRLARLQGRAELLRQCYWDCRKALKAHLDLAPSEEFEEAYRAIAATSARGTLAV